MVDAQTEARAIAKRFSGWPVKWGQELRNHVIEEIATALAAKDAELAAVKANCETVCNSYADENQRLYDRAERAEAELAEAKEELDVLRANQAAHVEVRARLTTQLAEAMRVLDDIATLDNNSLHHGPEFARHILSDLEQAAQEGGLL